MSKQDVLGEVSQKSHSELDIYLQEVSGVVAMSTKTVRGNRIGKLKNDSVSIKTLTNPTRTSETGNVLSYVPKSGKVARHLYLHLNHHWIWTALKEGV